MHVRVIHDNDMKLDSGPRRKSAFIFLLGEALIICLTTNCRYIYTYIYIYGPPYWFDLLVCWPFDLSAK